MGQPALPHALEMRELKYGAATPQERDRVAAQLESLDRHSQALLLFEGRPDAPGARRMLGQAVMAGSAFRVLSLKRIGLEVTSADLTACAQAAQRAGRWLDARACYLALGDSEAVRAFAEHLPPSLRPPPPPPPAAAATTTSH
jgi:hypothetical protein